MKSFFLTFSAVNWWDKKTTRDRLSVLPAVKVERY